MSAPRFPVIAICPGDYFLAIDSLRPIEAVSARALCSDYLARLYLFDSDGQRWRIARFEQTDARVKGPFGELVRVELTLSTPEQVQLSVIVEELCSLVDADPDDIYDQFTTHDELKRLLRAAATPRELVAAASALGAAS